MCCYADAKAKREFLKTLGTRKTFWAWKEIYGCGRCVHSSNYRYRPGLNKPKRLAKPYNTKYPSGVHVFMWEPYCSAWPNTKNVRVLCHRDDIVRIGWNQIVLRKLTILKANWLAAGLPKEAVKR